MIRITRRYDGVDKPTHTLNMTYQERTKGRIRVTSQSGTDFGLFLERGHPLKHGEKLVSEDGVVILINAEPEALIEAQCEDWDTFTRCCYHLGNRHVPIEIHALKLFMQQDNVLESMLKHLGMRTQAVHKGFHPEQGAYRHAH